MALHSRRSTGRTCCCRKARPRPTWATPSRCSSGTISRDTARRLKATPLFPRGYLKNTPQWPQANLKGEIDARGMAHAAALKAALDAPGPGTLVLEREYSSQSIDTGN